MVICLIFTAQSDARIDRKSIVGMWLFDDSTGKTVEDASGNATMVKLKVTLNGVRKENLAKLFPFPEWTRILSKYHIAMP